MNPSDPTDASSKNDQLDAAIRAALFEDGSIIPQTLEEVRKAKEKLREFPVTVPERLRDPSVVFNRVDADAKSSETQPATSSPKSKSNDCQNNASRAPDEFVEAIVISQLTRLLSQPDFPLGRFRYNKFSYFSHRRADEEVPEHYLKKAAGPYSPWARYQGPESIALKKGYVRRASAKGGLLPGDKIEAIDAYLSHYGVCRAIDWVVEKFRYRKNEELELLATVDLAAAELKQAGTEITVETVKGVIGSSTEWKPKLDRAAFSDDRIETALGELRSLFPLTYIG